MTPGRETRGAAAGATLAVEPVPVAEVARFRELVEDYWWELMRTGQNVKDEASRSAYFARRFHWDDGHTPPHWAIQNDAPVGFIHFAVDADRAIVEDFYVCPEVRRQGVGTRLVDWLLDQLDQRSVIQIDLDVRRDSPRSLAFWESRGFMIAHHQMTMHRDPATGEARRGALSSDFEEGELGFEPWKSRR